MAKRRPYQGRIYFSEYEEKDAFKEYLAGLFEGDGHIWISRQNDLTPRAKKKKHNPRFCITFGMRNEPLAKKLLEIIEFGFIRYKLQDNACVLVVSTAPGLKKITRFLNGRLRTPKIDQLSKLIDWLNKNHSANIDKLPLKTSSLMKDSWLSGFIDSDGSFSVQHTKLENGVKKRKISCRLRIEQRMLDPITKESYFNVLNQISYFLNCNLLTRKQKSTGNEYYTLTASSKISLSILVDYLENNPIFSAKYLDYLDWKKIAKLVINREQYTEQGINETESARKNMNRQRVYFNWDHLNSLKH